MNHGLPSPEDAAVAQRAEERNSQWRPTNARARLFPSVFPIASDEELAEKPLLNGRPMSSPRRVPHSVRSSKTAEIVIVAEALPKTARQIPPTQPITTFHSFISEQYKRQRKEALAKLKAEADLMRSPLRQGTSIATFHQEDASDSFGSSPRVGSHSPRSRQEASPLISRKSTFLFGDLAASAADLDLGSTWGSSTFLRPGPQPSPTKASMMRDKAIIEAKIPRPPKSARGSSRVLR